MPKSNTKLAQAVRGLSYASAAGGMASISVTDAETGETKTEHMPATAITQPAWLLRPCDYAGGSLQQRLERINDYFTQCGLHGTRPSLSGMALAAGYAGVTEMRRDAMRHPELRYGLSRAFTAVAHIYESMIGTGNASGPIFMLKNIPDFDSYDTPGAPAQAPYQDRLFIESRVRGGAHENPEDEKLTPRTAYLRLVRGEIVEDDDPVAPSSGAASVNEQFHVIENALSDS